MNESVARAYRRIRRESPYVPAKSAYQLAKWRVTAPMLDDGDTWTIDGFDMRVSVVYDDDFPYDGDDVPTFSHYATAESVSVRGIMPADDDYAETPYWTRSERIASYRRRGAGRALAIELAEKDMVAECRQYLDDDAYATHVITVDASRAGVRLGRASLGGVTFGSEWGDASRYVAECAAELESEAIESARESMRAICVGATS